MRFTTVFDRGIRCANGGRESSNEGSPVPFTRRPPGRCVSRRFSTAAFAARTAVERVQTKARRLPSCDALPVDAFHDFFDLGFFDGEVGDVEAVHDLLDGGS